MHLSPLIATLSASDLGSLNSTHFVDPSGARSDLTNSANLITSVTRNADVVATFKSELNVADLQNLGTTFFGVLAGCLKNLIDEVIGDS